MNDQILILISFTIYAAGSVAIPLYPSVMLLNVAGFITGIAFGVGHIGKECRTLTDFHLSELRQPCPVD